MILVLFPDDEKDNNFIKKSKKEVKMKEKWKKNEGKSELNLWLIFLKNIKGKNIQTDIYQTIYEGLSL